jgi:hypothetical protein
VLPVSIPLVPSTPPPIPLIPVLPTVSLSLPVDAAVIPVVATEPAR